MEYQVAAIMNIPNVRPNNVIDAISHPDQFYLWDVLE
jgi:hypothetical protein